MQENNSVEIRTYINAQPAKVWNTLTSREGMREWLGPKEYDPRVGGAIRFEVQGGPDKFIISGEIREMVAPKVLSFSWLEERLGHYKWPTETVVTIKLSPLHQGTLVTLEHSGFASLPLEIALSEFVDHLQGWTLRHYPFNNLENLVAKHGA